MPSLYWLRDMMAVYMENMEWRGMELMAEDFSVSLGRLVIRLVAVGFPLIWTLLNMHIFHMGTN